MLAVHTNPKCSDGYRIDGKTYFFRDGLCEVPEKVHAELVSMGVVEKVEKTEKVEKSEKKKENK